MTKENLIGKTFGRLTVIEYDSDSDQWKCRCSCGNLNYVRSINLKSGSVKSCGCLHKELLATRSTARLLGCKFGRLTVVRRNGSDIHGNALWDCKCDCGSPTIITTTSASLIRGHTQSCGCYKRLRSSEAHKVYTDDTMKYLAVRKMASMKRRCFSPTEKSYPRYGGRGITICQEWLDNPKAFAEWSIANGYKPGLSIDRIDVNGPYSPDNCRWATTEQQSVNKRNNRYIEIGGESKTISQWSKQLGVNKNNFYHATDAHVKERLEKMLASAAETEAPDADK